MACSKRWIVGGLERMTVYGWTPPASCYTPTGASTTVSSTATTSGPSPASSGPTGSAPAPATTDQQAATQVAVGCQSPTWWYSLLALAAIAGFAARGKRA